MKQQIYNIKDVTPENFFTTDNPLLNAYKKTFGDQWIEPMSQEKLSILTLNSNFDTLHTLDVNLKKAGIDKWLSLNQSNYIGTDDFLDDDIPMSSCSEQEALEYLAEILKKSKIKNS